MANDTKKPGAEPGGSQARLDEALSRLDGVQNAVQGLSANLAQSSDQTSESLGQITQSVDGLRSSVEQTSSELQVAAAAQSKLAKAIAQRDQLIEARLDKQDATIQLLADALTKLVASSEGSAAKAEKAAEATKQAIKLLDILAQEQRTAGTHHQTLAEAVAEANAAIAADREQLNSTVAVIDSKLDTGLGQLIELRSQTGEIAETTTRIDQNVSRILALMDVVIQGIEASQVYLAEVQYSVRRIEKGMLTTKMFFEVNKAMRNDLVSAMNKLPDELRRSTKDILQSAARIKHEAETNAASNAAQLALLKAQIEQMVNYYQTEGQGVIELLKEASVQFNTRLSNQIGKANLLLDQEVENYLAGTMKKLDGFSDQLKASDFQKFLTDLGENQRRAMELADKISAAITELDVAQKEVKEEIRDQVDLIKTSTKSLGSEVLTARTDIKAVSQGLTAVREYLVETNSNVLSYLDSARDAFAIAQKMVAADENGKLALYKDLFNNLVAMVVAGVSENQKGLFEQFGMELLTRDLNESNDAD